MATRHSTADDFRYLATTEEIDTYNEVHKKLVDFNLEIMLIDQQLQELVQECSQRGDNVPRFLKENLQEFIVEQESIKRRLRGMLMTFFESECCDLGNLESFILEQEVYNLMSTKSGVDLNRSITEIERWFKKSVRSSYNKISSWKRLFDRTPKMLNFGTSNTGQSANRAQSSQPQGLIEMSLSDVAVEIYGFSREEALDIQECVASQKMVSEALGKNGHGFYLDPMYYPDHQDLSKKSKPVDAEMLNWDRVTIIRKRLEDLYLIKNVDKGLEKILTAMKIWIFHMESVVCDLVYNLYAMISDYEPAVIKFQELNSQLKQLKERYNGVVPIIVYKILAMPRISCRVGFNRDKAVLDREFGFGEVILKFKTTITFLWSALSATSRLLHLQRMDQREKALISCQAAANIAEEFLKLLGMSIYGAKSRLKELQDASITKEETSASLTQTYKGKGKEICRD